MQSTVLIADDHAVYRRGLRDLIEPEFRVVAEAREGGEAVEKALAQRPNVVIMDIFMPGMDGIEAARQIKERLPETGLVVLSAHADTNSIFEAVQAGACGYVTKDDEPETVLQAIGNAAEGRAFLPPVVAQYLLDAVATASKSGKEVSLGSTRLSSRELPVLKLMAKGKKNREIADELCISNRTVGNHITSIYSKLGIYDRAQAIVYAIKKGIVRL